MNRLKLQSFLAAFSLLVSLAAAVVMRGEPSTECTKCVSPPRNLRSNADATPQAGGPPCRCKLGQRMQGCMLSDCRFTEEGEVCDSSNGNVGERKYAYSFLCREDAAACETCNATEYPPGCIALSYENPPIKGGPACSCRGPNQSPPGCTLMICKYRTFEEREGPCICNPRDFTTKKCFNPTCPGNRNFTRDPSSKLAASSYQSNGAATGKNDKSTLNTGGYVHTPSSSPGGVIVWEVKLLCILMLLFLCLV